MRFLGISCLTCFTKPSIPCLVFLDDSGNLFITVAANSVMDKSDAIKIQSPWFRGMMAAICNDCGKSLAKESKWLSNRQKLKRYAMVNPSESFIIY